MNSSTDLISKRGALSLVLLGAVALTACSDRTPEVSRTLEPIAQTAAKMEDRVTADQMADWIISKKQDYRLIDIRSEEAFEAGHIEGAEHIPLATLILPDTLQSLPSERKLVVYGNGSEQAAKASVMLRVAGFDAYLLLGGYNHWQDRILNPDIPAEVAEGETPEQALQRAISCYFASPGERTVKQLPPPEVQPVEPKGFTPPLTTGAGARPPMDEGC